MDIRAHNARVDAQTLDSNQQVTTLESFVAAVRHVKDTIIADFGDRDLEIVLDSEASEGSLETPADLQSGRSGKDIIWETGDTSPSGERISYGSEV